jgi:hypothetical protein
VSEPIRDQLLVTDSRLIHTMSDSQDQDVDTADRKMVIDESADTSQDDVQDKQPNTEKTASKSVSSGRCNDCFCCISVTLIFCRCLLIRWT